MFFYYLLCRAFLVTYDRWGIVRGDTYGYNRIVTEINQLNKFIRKVDEAKNEITTTKESL